MENEITIDNSTSWNNSVDIDADTAEEIIKIDVESVLRDRLGKGFRFVPRAVVRWLKRTVCQDQLNEMLEVNRGRRGAEFCRGVLSHLDVKVDIEGVEKLPPADNRRVVFVSNHPLGGLDGMALIDFVERRYGVAPKFIVNDLLMAIKPLGDVFVPINKHGAQSREAARNVDEAFAGDSPLIIFPAGLCSRRQKKGVVADLQWKKSFVNKAKQSRRDVIPLHFCGENSPFFYKFAKWRKRLGIKFNIEMVYLPREVFLSRGKRFKIVIGDAVRWSDLATGRDAQATADTLRETVYSLKPSD